MLLLLQQTEALKKHIPTIWKTTEAVWSFRTAVSLNSPPGATSYCPFLFLSFKAPAQGDLATRTRLSTRDTGNGLWLDWCLNAAEWGHAPRPQQGSSCHSKCSAQCRQLVSLFSVLPVLEGNTNGGTQYNSVLTLQFGWFFRKREKWEVNQCLFTASYTMPDTSQTAVENRF